MSFLIVQISSSLAHTRPSKTSLYLHVPAKYPVKGFHYGGNSLPIPFLYPHDVGVASSPAHISILLSTAPNKKVYIRGREGWKKSFPMFYRGKLMRGEESKAAFGTSTLLDVNPFLMGSRVQRGGRDYRGRSGSGVTCICPRQAGRLTLCTTPWCTTGGVVGARVKRLGLSPPWGYI